MDLRTPMNVQELQRALHAKAKKEPKYRFYALYDKVYRRDVLGYAYEQCYANAGAPGVDGQTFEDIETYGRERWLGELARDLVGKTYRSGAVRRVWIPKANGSQRPIGIPTIRDRTVEMAVLTVISPVFEADLQPEQYGYREGRGALEAVREVHRLINEGHREVVDADLSGYFDSIPHGALMKSIARRICDKEVLRLIKMWLDRAVEERGKKGKWQRTTRNKDEHKGIPQGSPISPLLSNIYMRRFVLGWKTQGMERKLDAHVINYADDFVICCRGTAIKAERAMRDIMGRIGLRVNEEKTHVRYMPEESVEFLGYTIGQCYSTQTGRSYIGTKPAKKRVQRICQEVYEQTTRKTLCREVEDVVKSLNRQLRGWANYFCLGPVSKAYRAVDTYVTHRLRQWLCRKHKKAGRGTSRYPANYLYQTLGLIRLPELTRSFSWAKA